MSRDDKNDCRGCPKHFLYIISTTDGGEEKVSQIYRWYNNKRGTIHTLIHIIQSMEQWPASRFTPHCRIRRRRYYHYYHHYYYNNISHVVGIYILVIIVPYRERYKRSKTDDLYHASHSSYPENYTGTDIAYIRKTTDYERNSRMKLNSAPLDFKTRRPRWQ